jgi:hypothetical protein
MATPKLPSLPARMRASELINGSDADFVINAYLALQRHWPDAGGYAHYLYFLSQHPHDRLAVLREIAASESAQHCGTELEMDLPDQYLYVPLLDSGQTPRDTAATLRITKAIAEVDALRQSIASLTLEGLSGALETVVQTQQATLSALESRLNEVQDAVQALQPKPGAAAAQPADPADDAQQAAPAVGDSAWMQAELSRMAQRIAQLERVDTAPDQGGKLPAEAGLHDELTALRAEVRQLRHATALDVKRQVADYFKALSGVSPTRPHAVNDANLQPPVPAFRHA